jgi:hypothetical protein
MQQEPPCSACGQPSRTSGVIHSGPWDPLFDRRREFFLATPPTLRVPPARFLEELRDAAADA